MEPLTVTICDAKHALGIGTTKLYELIAQDRIRVVKLGRRTLVRVDSLRRVIDDLGDE